MSAFKAGTVFVDVVPSMRGFFKEVAGDVRGQMPQVGAESGREFAEGFRKSVSASGKDLANAVADPLGKSAARLRQEAASAGRALSAAQEGVASSGRALAAAREKEASAAAGLESAEAALNRVRSSGSASASEVSRAEAAYAKALNASKTANSQADTAASAHSRALGKETQAAKTADRANDELARATGHAKQEANQANPAMRGLSQSVTGVGSSADRAGSSVGRIGGRMSSIGSLARSAMGPLLALGATVGVGGYASEAIEASDATDKFVSTLRFAGVDTATIDQLKNSAKEYADKTIYDLSDIQSITSQLAANGVSGFDQLAEAAGNLNAVAGGNAETFKSVGMVLTQTAGQGKLTTENWNQLADAIPGASGQLQKALLDAGAYTGNFREAMEAGEISADEFNQAILDLGMTDVAKEAATSTSTMEGAWGNFQATMVSGAMQLVDTVKPAVTGLLSDISDKAASAFDWVEGTMVPSLQSVWNIFSQGDFTGPIFGFEEDSALVDWLFRLRDAGVAVWDTLVSFGNAALSVAGSLSPLLPLVGGLSTLMAGALLDAVTQVVTWLGQVFDWISRNSDVVGSLAVALGAAITVIWAFNTAQTALTAINAAGSIMALVRSTNLAKAATAAWNVVMNANPIMLVVTAIAALVAGLVYFFTQTETGKRVWASITAAFQSFIDWIGPAWNSMLQAVSDWWSSTWSTVKDTFDTWVVQPLTTGWNAITGAFQTAWGYIQAGWAAITGVFQTAWGIIQTVWNGITAAFQTAWGIIQAVWNGIAFAAQVAFAVIVGVVLTPMQVAINVLGDVFTWLWVSVIQPVWTGIAATFTSVYSSVIKPVFDWLVALWTSVAAQAQAIWQGMKDFIGSIWNAISAVIMAAWAYIRDTVQSYITMVMTIVTTVFTAVRNGVSVIWNAISAVIMAAWAYIRDTVQSYITMVMTIVTTVFTAVRSTVSSIWNGIRSVISGVWEGIKTAASTAVNWVKDTVTGVFERMKSAVASTFGGMKSAIESVWNKVKAAAAKPVNYVIRTVYTNGLKKMVESVASKIGLSLTLPAVAEIGGYAGGGVIPGYAPGRDTVPAMLSPGEAVLVPELVRQIGVDRILAANWVASRRRPGGSPGYGANAYAGGGVAHFAEGGIVGWFKDAAKGVADFFADPVGATVKLIATPVRALFGGLGSGFMGDIAKAGINKILDGLGEYFKKKTEDGGATGGGSGLVGAARRAIGVPYVWGGSSIPPGLDCSGLVYWAARQLGWGWPRLTAAGYQSGSRPVAWGAKVPGDLLFWGSPAHHVAIYAGGNRMIEEPHEGASGRDIGIWGSPTVGRYGSGKYDAGGWLPPGVTAAVNRTGAREAVLTARQWSDVSALAARGSGVDLDDLDGIEMHLVLDDGEAFDGHLEVVATRAARRAGVLRGRRA
ncbi:tape measure protein [Actinomyces israelii]